MTTELPASEAKKVTGNRVPSSALLGSVAVYMWNGSGLNVLIPKKRGSGYLRQPYGHHAVYALDEIAYDEGCDLCGLDGYLTLEYGMITDAPKQAETIARVMPRLATHYGFAAWREDPPHFWSVLLPGGDLIAKTKIVCPSWYRLRWRERKDEAGRVVEISCDPPCRFELSNVVMSHEVTGAERAQHDL